MNIFPLFMCIYCLLEEETVIANENECSTINQTETGGYFRLDGHKVRVGCNKRIKVNKGFHIKMLFNTPQNNISAKFQVQEFSDGKKSMKNPITENRKMYESNTNEINVRIDPSSTTLEVYWLRECGKWHQQTTKLYEVTSPLGYPTHFKCNWTVSSSPEYRIMLEVLEIKAYNQTLGGCFGDYIQVTGMLEGETQTTNTCLTEETPTLYYKSPVYIRFDSDTINDSWIRFKFKTRLVNFLRGHHGRFLSSGYPGDYSNSSSQKWIIEAPMGFHIQLTFDEFQLEKKNNGTCYDYVKIIDPGQEDIQNRERSYCGTSLANSSMTSAKQRIEVLFDTDQGVSDKGFSASWLTVCGGKLKGDSGELVGPNNAFGYPENQDCIWNIRVQNGYKLLMTLNASGYNDSTNCTSDYIQVVKGQSEQGLLKGRFCSGIQDFESCTSMTIIFHSDNDPSTGLSFNVTWASKCVENFYSDSGELSSPDNPVDYDQKVRCNWTIRVSSGHTIALNYSLLKTSNDEAPCNSYVQVMEADSNAPKILCKSDTFAVYRSSSNIVTISFKHEPGKKYTRFYAKWHTEDARWNTEDKILRTVAAPVALAMVIIVIIVLLLVRRVKSLPRFSKRKGETTESTYDHIYDCLEEDIKVKTSKFEYGEKNHHLPDKPYELQSFRTRLPTPTTGRCSRLLARFNKTIQIRNSGCNTVYAYPKERRRLSLKIDQSDFNQCKEEATLSRQERLSKNSDCTMESFTNADYISADNVDQDLRRGVISAKVAGKDCEDNEDLKETLGNDVELRLMNFDCSDKERSYFNANSDSFELRVDIHREDDNFLTKLKKKNSTAGNHDVCCTRKGGLIDATDTSMYITLDKSYFDESMDCRKEELHEEEVLFQESGVNSSTDSYLSLPIYRKYTE
ncbi:hypothetical protein CHS0354_015460 [Potamilus streckersoni]|uniref:CUB domain-containing protein n=1 Tax=Potamilus streckersoni TaxID=2493646 RepID=A0AAE0RQY4_9BIVA|nr:hypothetical protein CHS0354_015460 [Potamilus streckersoni]